MKVSDVMSKQVDSISYKARVEKAALLIFNRNIHGVPVVKDRKVVGFITEKDILAKFHPTFREYIADLVHSSNFEEMENEATNILNLPVEKIMSRDIKTVKPNTPLLKAHALMAVNEIGRLPVVDDEGNLIGMVSKSDVFRSLIGDRLLTTENEDYNDFLSKTYYATVDWNSRIKNEIPDLIKLFEREKVKSIIDIGSGTGDHSIEFAKKGYKVVGIDKSTPMIREANRKKTLLKKEFSEKVNFHFGNVKEVLKDLSGDFDCALFLGNTLSHNPTNYREIIKEVADKIADNGTLVFQITNFVKVLKVNKRILNFNFVDPKNNVNSEFAFIEFYDNPDLKNKTILKTFAILTSDKKRWEWAGIRNSLMAYITEQELVDYLHKIGFKNVKTHGGYFDGRTWDRLFSKPFDPLKSDWLNIIATK